MTSRTPLGDYIKAYIDSHDAGSRNAFTARARDPDTGNTLRVQWVIDLLNDRVNRAPELWRLQALAAAMSARENTGPDRSRYREHLELLRRLTAAQYLELEVLSPGQDSTLSVVVPTGLSAEKRALVARWAETMARDLAESELDT